MSHSATTSQKLSPNQIEPTKPSMGKNALLLCAFILAVSFVYFILLQGIKQEEGYQTAVIARTQLQTLQAEQIKRKPYHQE